MASIEAVQSAAKAAVGPEQSGSTLDAGLSNTPVEPASKGEEFNLEGASFPSSPKQSFDVSGLVGSDLNFAEPKDLAFKSPGIPENQEAPQAPEAPIGSLSSLELDKNSVVTTFREGKPVFVRGGQEVDLHFEFADTGMDLTPMTQEETRRLLAANRELTKSISKSFSSGDITYTRKISFLGAVKPLKAISSFSTEPPPSPKHLDNQALSRSNSNGPLGLSVPMAQRISAGDRDAAQQDGGEILAGTQVSGFGAGKLGAIGKVSPSRRDEEEVLPDGLIVEAADRSSRSASPQEKARQQEASRTDSQVSEVLASAWSGVLLEGSALLQSDQVESVVGTEARELLGPAPIELIAKLQTAAEVQRILLRQQNSEVEHPPLPLSTNPLA